MQNEASTLLNEKFSDPQQSGCFAGADLRTAQWSAEERCKYTEVKCASEKGYYSYEHHNQGSHSVESKPAQNNQRKAAHDAYNATCVRSQEKYKWVHLFISFRVSVV